MSSIIEGYNYDIFISYRQKDNKHDGWVTEFVDNLKGELEATFKEEISVYFDINPHDGLLETHDVDASLKEKLKCLVFIPIISRTYCDPKSFAWEHEFVAFNKLAKEDQFGRDIKLTSGNVASRILPIKIYDLDPEDKTLLENELGGVLRCIEFIYYSAGVNRPLRVNEDHPQENLNKTYYRDQINKVANAVKEVFSGLKKFGKSVSSIASNYNSNVLTYINKSIAVLPFTNMSNDPEQEYFSDGIAEEILNSLTHIKTLKIAGRSSSFQFKGKNPDLREVGKKLGVETILEGSVRKQGNQLRITVQLINVEDGFHIWSERYDRKMDDVFAIQDEIANAMTDHLKLILTEQEHKRINYTPTTNHIAYDLYLKGRFCWNNRTERGLKKSADFFNQAIKEDPGYALAYTGLADSYNMLGFYAIVSPDDAFPKAQKLAQKALNLNETLAEAHTSLAFSKFYYYRDWVTAEKEFLRAIELNTGYATAHHWYSEYLLLTGRMNESLEEAKKALETDPLSLIINTLIGFVYYYKRNYNQAIDWLEKTIELDPSFSNAYFWLGLAYGEKSEFAKAFSLLQKALSFSENQVIISAALGIVKAKSGDISETKKIINDLDKLSEETYVSPYYIAALYDAIGNQNQSFRLLGNAFKEHDIWIAFLNVDPLWDNLRSDKRFHTLLKDINC